MFTIRERRFGSVKAISQQSRLKKVLKSSNRDIRTNCQTVGNDKQVLLGITKKIKNLFDYEKANRSFPLHEGKDGRSYDRDRHGQATYRHNSLS